MKRMTEQPVGYFTVKPEDLQNIELVDSTNKIYTYTPSERFLEVVKSLECPLRIDWREVYEPITLQVGIKYSVLYPINLSNITDDELGYNYSSPFGGDSLNVIFYYLNGSYCIHFA